MRPDGDEPQLRFVETTVGPPASEPTGTGRPSRHVDRRWIVAGALVATLVIGIVIGFVSGRHGAKSAAAKSVSPASPSASPSFLTFRAPSLRESCSAQSGKQLQLGVEIVNESALPFTIDGLQPVLPLGGLRTRRISTGECGRLGGPGPDEVVGYNVAANASVWINITMDVLVPCPAPLPVQLRIRTTQSGLTATTDLSPFPDLGQVPYSGCPTS
jgi:hypothetical protein